MVKGDYKMPRGRRVNSSGEKSKQLLQEKAIELFSSNGYHDTKISDIVKSANLTQPTFYLYFESKDSIYNDLIHQFENDFENMIEEQKDLYVKTSDYDFIKSFLVNLFEYYAAKGKLTKIVFDNKESSHFINETLKKLLVEKLGEIEFDGTKVDFHIFVESLLGAIQRLTLTTLLTNIRNAQELADDLMNIYFVQSKELVK